MKLKEIKEILDTYIPQLNMFVGKAQFNNKEYSSLQNLRNLRAALQEIETTGLFNDLLAIVKASPIYEIGEDQILLEHNVAKQLQGTIDRMRDVGNGLRTALERVVGESEENSVFIKLPEVTDFTDLAKAADTFQTILNQAVVNDEIKGEIKIKSVENGSIWLNVYLGTAAAVSLLGGIAWAAAVVYKKAQEGRYLAETVRAKRIQNENKVDIGAAYKEILGILVEAEAEHLHSEYFKTNSHEQIERLKLSIKLLSEEMEKGAEVHPSLTAPENVVNLFPNMKQIVGIESKIKKLTDGNHSDSESAA